MAKTWTEAGRGRKECPNCKIYIGVRSKTCPECKHTFETGVRRPSSKASSKDPKKALPERPEPRATDKPRIIAPSGRCPVELASSDPEEVERWVNELQGRHRSVELSKQAFLMWARSFFPYHSEGYRQVRDCLEGLS